MDKKDLMIIMLSLCLIMLLIDTIFNSILDNGFGFDIILLIFMIIGIIISTLLIIFNVDEEK